LKPRLRTLKPRLQTVGPRIAVSGSWRSDKTGANARGYTYRWQKAREWFLRQHPLCECPDCDAGRKRITPATVVDHRIPHRGDERLFWDESNWQAMAKACHDRKTAMEQGHNPKREIGEDGWPK